MERASLFASPGGRLDRLHIDAATHPSLEPLRRSEESEDRERGGSSCCAVTSCSLLALVALSISLGVLVQAKLELVAPRGASNAAMPAFGSSALPPPPPPPLHGALAAARAVNIKDDAPTALQRLLDSQAAWPSGPRLSSSELRELLADATCRWSACRPADAFLEFYIVTVSGATAHVSSVDPQWRCAKAGNPCGPPDDWLCAGATPPPRSATAAGGHLPPLNNDWEHAARAIGAALVADGGSAAAGARRNLSVVLDLTDRCTLDFLIDSCRVPLLCHAARPGSCAIPIPYRDWWTDRYGIFSRSADHRVSHRASTKHAPTEPAPTQSLYYRGQPRGVCMAPPWHLLCHRTRLAWIAHSLCEGRHTAAPMPPLAAHDPPAGAASAATIACPFDVKLVSSTIRPANHSCDAGAAGFFARNRDTICELSGRQAAASSFTSGTGAAEDWRKHQFMAEADGFGYSGATMWKLLTNRTLVVPESAEKLATWHSRLMRPSVHYLRLSHDFSASGLAAVLRTSPEAARAIASNALGLGLLLAAPSFGRAYLRRIAEHLEAAMPVSARAVPSTPSATTSVAAVPRACAEPMSSGLWGLPCERELCFAAAAAARSRASPIL
jgi:hypothetical protein